MNKKILGIIPARGGSKGLPNKNILLMDGKPLLWYTINSALKSKFLDKVVVSTEDARIKQVALQSKADVIDRPIELAMDSSPTFDAIKHVIDSLAALGETYDIVVLLEPTSPLRKLSDIDGAISEFVNNFDKADGIISLGELTLENPYITKVIENGYISNFIKSEERITQRQQLKKVFFPYGVFYISKTQSLLKYKTFYHENVLPYYIEAWQNYEIDDIYDFKVIEFLLKDKKGEII